MWHGQKLSSLNLFAAYLAHVGQILRCLQLRDACAPPPQRPHVSASSKREVNLRVIRNSPTPDIAASLLQGNDGKQLCCRF
jgi:hypothetical protein